ncbi:MAG: extracellular solute-binding protein [Proteobacteria bacterium]|nr:extracellular solute-binding protein [Pseudomonadota bacterium]
MYSRCAYSCLPNVCQLKTVNPNQPEVAKCAMQSKAASNALATCVVLSLVLPVVAACGKKSDGAAAPTAQTLFIANYEGYIGKDTVANFERASGVRVKYGTYDSANTLESWVWAGDLRYDVVSTSSDFFSREIKAGAFRALDRSKLPNWKNLDPAALDSLAQADPGNRHAVPYLHSINGFAYNIDMIRARMPEAPVDSLDMLFKPEVVRRFADCGVTFLDSPSDVLPLALNYLHLDPNSASAEDYKAAEKLLQAVRPYIRTFDSLEYLTDLASGETCLAMGYSSDAAATRSVLRANGSQIRLAFTVPKEGACISFDAFLIPVSAPDPDAAYRFINFLLEPQVIAAITNEIHYGNNNRAADPYVESTIREDPSIYPSPQMRARLYQQAEAGAATERIRTRTWTSVKTGT